MSITAGTIARELGVLVSEIVGDPDRLVTRVAGVKAAAPGRLLFIKPNLEGIDAVLPTEKREGTILICSFEHAEHLGQGDFTIIVAENPRLAFLRSVEAFFKNEAPPPGIHPTAVVDSTAKIGADVSVGAHCFVGPNCQVGENCVLHANVTLVRDVVLGRRVIINSGTVVGADGFGYERNAAGMLEKFPHLGGVLIEDDVEIGSNTSIDRGTLDDTIIRAFARIDNQVHIAHNVTVGRHCAIIAQAMVGGSVSIADYSWLAPSATVMNQVKIGERATVGLGAVVTKDVRDQMTVMGSPAEPIEDFRALRAALKRLVNP
ncbi:UDP-3-O-acylglucosamine N-acyltransferase [Brevundimonas denitrificans]|uniref:UDP-3-O-acylglucosamine N-acyltransferase n=1 Tax=Brevundimonas denitrificans TaxID=1443434 RepID=A0ABQ6BDV1_9CAUL|nr:UDP-3-O-(3-hydroxymyristoyl)glucosamine N-acyltransferase [Brevundimonas denitrificans]GLS00180.1 UDP-3-O-acylglucosamine N-acyltransferase [Brevundimonas denitrificans]